MMDYVCVLAETLLDLFGCTCGGFLFEEACRISKRAYEYCSVITVVLIIDSTAYGKRLEGSDY